MNRNASPHFSPLTTLPTQSSQVRSSFVGCLLEILSSPVAMGNCEAARENALEAVVTNLHIGGPGHVVVLHWTETEMNSGSLLDDRAVLFRITLLAS